VAEVTVKYADTGIDAGRIFARSFGADEFAKHGLNSTVAQVNFAYRHAHGTLRGLHWQMPPLGEAELVRCARGVIFAMAVDIRRESATFSKARATSRTAFRPSPDDLAWPLPITVISEKPAGR